MTDAITPDQFHTAVPATEWQVDGESAQASYATGSFALGVTLVVEIGRLADALDHHPEITLTYPTVEVRLSSHDIGGLSRRDADLAHAISTAARALGIPAAAN